MKTKVYILLMFIFLVTLNSCNQSNSSDLDLWNVKNSADIKQYDLEGQVNTYQSKHYKAHSDLGQIVIDSLTNFTFVDFDEKGNIIELRDSNKIYNNELITIKSEFQNNQKIVYIHINNIKEVKEVKSFNNNLLSVIEKYNSEDRLISKTEVKYNENNIATEMVTYGEGGNIESKKYNCVFDKCNNYLEFTYAMGDSLSYRYQHEYKYFSNGKLKEHLIYDCGNDNDNKVLLHKEIYESVKGSESRLIQTYNFDYSGNLLDKYFLEYNKNGDICQYSTYNDADMLLRSIKYDLKYDEKGNITERLTYLNNNIINITKNEYTYY